VPELALASPGVTAEERSFCCDEVEVPLHCVGGHSRQEPIFLARAPVGLEPAAYVLTEDGVVLSPPSPGLGSLRELPGGQWTIQSDQIYFTTSDGSDAQTNGRCYRLARKGLQLST